jgi:hypothetical protein
MSPLACKAVVLGVLRDDELTRPRADRTIALAVSACLTAWSPWGPVTNARHWARLLIAASNLFVTVLPLNLFIANSLGAFRTTTLGMLCDFIASRHGSITARGAAVAPLAPFTFAVNFTATIAARNCVGIPILIAAFFASKLVHL